MISSLIQPPEGTFRPTMNLELGVHRLTGMLNPYFDFLLAMWQYCAMVTTTSQLAELFYFSGAHSTFNAAVAIGGHQCMDLLRIAAELDAEEFLIRHPNLWQDTNPCELATKLAQDFVERWPVLCPNFRQT